MSLLTLFLVTQARTTNIPLFLLFGIQFDLLSRLHLSSMQITITTLICGQVSFFALGNSNAISSIDLSNAYNGVSGYNILAVGALVFLGNWAGPVWWSLAGVALLVQASSPADSLSVQAEDKAMTRRKWVQMELDNLATKKSEVEDDTTRMPGDALFHTHSMMLTLFTSISLLAIMVACTVLRTHLFIWTVFSPKYLFAMSWTVAFHEMISLAIGSAIWRFCT
jgi:ethanolaminephosphotransferase